MSRPRAGRRARGSGRQAARHEQDRRKSGEIDENCTISRGCTMISIDATPSVATPEEDLLHACRTAARTETTAAAAPAAARPWRCPRRGCKGASWAQEKFGTAPKAPLATSAAATNVVASARRRLRRSPARSHRGASAPRCPRTRASCGRERRIDALGARHQRQHVVRARERIRVDDVGGEIHGVERRRLKVDQPLHERRYGCAAPSCRTAIRLRRARHRAATRTSASRFRRAAMDPHRRDARLSATRHGRWSSREQRQRRVDGHGVHDRHNRDHLHERDADAQADTDQLEQVNAPRAPRQDRQHSGQMVISVAPKTRSSQVSAESPGVAQAARAATPSSAT